MRSGTGISWKGGDYFDLLHFSDFIKTETTTFDEKTLWKHIKPILSKL